MHRYKKAAKEDLKKITIIKRSSNDLLISFLSSSGCNADTASSYKTFTKDHKHILNRRRVLALPILLGGVASVSSF